MSKMVTWEQRHRLWDMGYRRSVGWIDRALVASMSCAAILCAYYFVADGRPSMPFCMIIWAWQAWRCWESPIYELWSDR